MTASTPESKLAALPLRVLYYWLEGQTYMRIVEEPNGQKRLQMVLGGHWQDVRPVSDSEYDLLFKDHAEGWQREED